MLKVLFIRNHHTLLFIRTSFYTYKAQKLTYFLLATLFFPAWAWNLRKSKQITLKIVENEVANKVYTKKSAHKKYEIEVRKSKIERRLYIENPEFLIQFPRVIKKSLKSSHKEV